VATRLEIVNRVSRALARSGLGTTAAGDVADYLHATIREDICGDHSWPWMKKTGPVFTTTSGLDVYPVPETESGLLKDIRVVEWREVASGDTEFEFSELMEVSEEALYEGSAESGGGGTPCMWALASEREIRINMPDDEYELRCLTHEYPEELQLDTSTNYLTTHFPRLLEYGVLSRMFLYYEQHQAHGQYEKLFQQEKSRILGVDRRIIQPDNMVMRPSLAAGRRVWGRGRRGSLRSWPMDYDD